MVLRGSCQRAMRVVLESSEEPFQGIGASGQPGNRRHCPDLAGFDCYLQGVLGAQPGPWVPVLSLHPLLCDLGPVPVLPGASISPLRSLASWFWLGWDLISGGSWQGTQEGLSRILPPAQHQSRSRDKQTVDGSEPGEGELEGQVPETPGLGRRSSLLAC